MVKTYIKNDKTSKRAYKKIAGGVLLAMGFAMLIYFFLPVVLWQFYFSSASATSDLQTPIPKSLVVTSDKDFASLFSQGLSGILTNYQDARNWYPGFSSDSNSKISSYTLSIPKLSLSNLLVSAVDYNLSLHLIQYPGTAEPGARGTAVVLGHSTLPQLFNPTNYKTIFARLHDIKAGDQISINVSGVIYDYSVYSIFVTDADDTTVFSQNYDNSYLTLITCTPPGTVWKRLIVRAKLEKVQK